MPPGCWAGYDPAEVNDQAGLIILQKDGWDYYNPNPNPRLKIRTIRDLSLDDSGKKCVTYLGQVKKIIELHKRYKFNKICVDATSHKTVVELLESNLSSTCSVEGITFTKPRKSSMIQTTRLLFQERLLELNPDLPNFMKLRQELYELDPAKLKHPQNGSDDFAWALALAIEATGATMLGKPSTESGYSSEELMF